MAKLVNKKTASKEMRWLKTVKLWQLLILFILVCFVAATFLRLNSVGMAQRRSAVLAADKSGDETQLMQRLMELQHYSSTHMNADTGPLYLQHQYERDVQAAMKKASEESADPKVHAAAEEACHARFQGWSMEYVRCFVAELDKYPTKEAFSDPKLPDTELYRHEYSSPLWTPDFAGWSTLVALILLFIMVLRAIGIVFLRILLRYKYRSI